MQFPSPLPDSFYYYTVYFAKIVNQLKTFKQKHMNSPAAAEKPA